MISTSRTALLLSLFGASSVVSSFSPSCMQARSETIHSTTTLGAMERLHDPSANSYGRAEHIYSLRDIDAITRKISDDEWTALGSVIAEAMYETILDVGDDALKRRGWADRMSVTDRIAEEVSESVEKTLRKVRHQPSGSFDRGPHPLPEELVTSLQTLLRHELGTIVGLDEGAQFDHDGRDLSLIVLSSASDAIESYCGISDIDAPFFDLSDEMEHRIRDRRRELLVEHSKGYESVGDVAEDIERSRRGWTRRVLGNKAANNYEFGEVTTRAGNEHSHEKEKRAR
eukprot:16456_1